METEKGRGSLREADVYVGRRGIPRIEGEYR